MSTSAHRDTPWGVAYDLMIKIAALEAATKKSEREADPRAYYLALYEECVAAVASGGPLKA